LSGFTCFRQRGKKGREINLRSYTYLYINGPRRSNSTYFSGEEEKNKKKKRSSLLLDLNAIKKGGREVIVKRSAVNCQSVRLYKKKRRNHRWYIPTRLWGKGPAEEVVIDPWKKREEGGGDSDFPGRPRERVERETV